MYELVEVKMLMHFLSSAKENPTIGTTDICLYAALFKFYLHNNSKNPISVNRQIVMETAKILGVATYHKSIKSLVSSGFIKYEPSYNPAIRTKIFLL